MVYAYHTGIDGLYGLRSGEPPRHRAWMQTDGHGRFSLRTMIPASYPNSRIRPHVHYQLWGGGVPVQWSSTYNIDGSPRLVRQRGVWRVEHPLRAKATGDVLEPSIRHGVRDAPKRAPAHGRIVVHS